MLLLCNVILILVFFVFFFFKQKTAYEMRISDWSSDVCSSDLRTNRSRPGHPHHRPCSARLPRAPAVPAGAQPAPAASGWARRPSASECKGPWDRRSEEHTSELQSLMRISYAVFCLQKKTHNKPSLVLNKNRTQSEAIHQPPCLT